MGTQPSPWSALFPNGPLATKCRTAAGPVPAKPANAKAERMSSVPATMVAFATAAVSEPRAGTVSPVPVDECILAPPCLRSEKEVPHGALVLGSPNASATPIIPGQRDTRPIDKWIVRIGLRREVYGTHPPCGPSLLEAAVDSDYRWGERRVSG